MWKVKANTQKEWANEEKAIVNYLVLVGPGHHLLVVPTGQRRWSTAEGGLGRFVHFQFSFTVLVP